MSSNTVNTTLDGANDSQGLVSKITAFLTTKKGMYVIAAVVLVGAIYYYTQCYKKPAAKDTKNKVLQEQQQQQEQEYQPPPGYVTVPAEMLQGLQQGEPMYGQVPEEYPENMNLQTQQMHPMQERVNEQESRRVPKLRHNQIEDEEDEEIQEQNLSKQEMESIQAQLNAMQQQRGNPNNA